MTIRSKVLRSVAGIVPHKDLEDIVQETYLRLHEMEGTAHIRNPEAFIFQTARNLALDHRKRAESRLVDAHDDLERADEVALQLSTDTLEGDAIYREVAAGKAFGDFCTAVQALPPQCRRVFVLRKVYGFSQKEIAATLGLSQSSVEKHVARGLRLVCQSLQADRQPAGGVVADIAVQRARRRGQ